MNNLREKLKKYDEEIKIKNSSFMFLQERRNVTKNTMEKMYELLLKMVLIFIAKEYFGYGKSPSEKLFIYEGFDDIFNCLELYYGFGNLLEESIIGVFEKLNSIMEKIISNQNDEKKYKIKVSEKLLSEINLSASKLVKDVLEPTEEETGFAKEIHEAFRLTYDKKYEGLKICSNYYQIFAFIAVFEKIMFEEIHVKAPLGKNIEQQSESSEKIREDQVKKFEE